MLKRLLPYVNRGQYDEQDGYVIFGASSVWDLINDLTDRPDDRKDRSTGDAVREFVSDSKVHAGRSHVAERVSLNQLPTFKTHALDGLSPEPSKALHEALKILSREDKRNAEPLRHLPSDVQDALDAALAEEMLGNYPMLQSAPVALRN